MGADQVDRQEEALRARYLQQVHHSGGWEVGGPRFDEVAAHGAEGECVGAFHKLESHRLGALSKQRELGGSPGQNDSGVVVTMGVGIGDVLEVPSDGREGARGSRLEAAKGVIGQFEGGDNHVLLKVADGFRTPCPRRAGVNSLSVCD